MSATLSRRSFIAAIPLAIGALSVLAGCGEDSNTEPLDLTGTWVSISDDGEINMTAVIEGDEITIYWGDSIDNLFSVFWAGSYDAPNKSTSSWSWKSKKDADKYGYAFAASDADTIEFTYKNDVITFEASLYGLTQIAELQRIKPEQVEETEIVETQPTEDNSVTYRWNVYRDENGEFIVTEVDLNTDTSDWDGVFMSINAYTDDDQRAIDAAYDHLLQQVEEQYDEMLDMRRESLGLE